MDQINFGTHHKIQILIANSLNLKKGLKPNGQINGQ